jgi:predicted esterase
VTDLAPALAPDLVPLRHVVRISRAVRPLPSFAGPDLSVVAAPRTRGALTGLGRRPHRDPLPPGLHWPLGHDERAPVLHVPTNLSSGPVPLVVLLHAAASTGVQALPIVSAQAEQRGVLVLAPTSVGRTWDAIAGAFDTDVPALDAALATVSDHFVVDPQRVTVAGFGDGGSYALALGLANGRLFRRVVAFSPGDLPSGRRLGTPSLFVAHGTHDSVLPIDESSRVLVPALRREGYPVEYREFAGDHRVPQDVVSAAFDWLG